MFSRVGSALSILLVSLVGCATPIVSEDPKAGGGGHDTAADKTNEPTTGDPAPTAPRASSLAADNTMVLIAGVLEWPEASGITGFEATGRQDAALHEHFVNARGVAKDRATLLLDEQATRANILDGLRALVKKATADDTIVFYFAGHGSRDPERTTVVLMNYDIDPNRVIETGVSVADVVAAFEGAPAGMGVLLLGDFCFSGGLGTAADALVTKGLRASSVTSADVGNSSTGSWTYTQTLIDALSGSALADRNGDGVIDLKELGGDVHDAMKFVERQRSSASFHGDLVVSTVSSGTQFGAGNGALRAGSYAKLADDRIVQIRSLDGSSATVRHLRYSDSEQLTMPLASLQKIEFQSFTQGSEVRVEWEGKNFDATVKQVDDDFHLVSYNGFNASWDEWVLDNRIVTE